MFLSKYALGLLTFLSILVLECRLFKVTAADKCRLIFFIARFLKLLGKTSEAEELFLSIENMLLQVNWEIIFKILYCIYVRYFQVSFIFVHLQFHPPRDEVMNNK